MTARALSALCLALSLCACDKEGSGPPAVYDCAEATHFYVFNESILSDCYAADGSPCENQAIALVKGMAAIPHLRAFDDDGNACDHSLIEVTFDDAALVTAGTFEDGRPTYTAGQDLFDREDRNEPITIMRAALGDGSEAWQVNAVVDLRGVWEVTVDGIVAGDFRLAQAGRTIRWAECSEDDDSPQCQAGEVLRDKVTLRGYGGLTLDGTIAPTRDRVEGTWASGANTGAWSGVKIE
jgi:hypothetical protein